MNKTCSATAVLLVCMFGRLAYGQCNPSTLVYWRFESEGDFTDSCGSFDGTPVGQASVATTNCAPGVPGGSSGCLLLTGNPDRVDLPAPFPTPTPLGEGTFEAWVYLEAAPEGGGCIFNHGTAAVSTDLQASVDADPPFLSGLAWPSHAADFFNLPGFTLQTWHHLAWTWDQTAVTWYYDGQEIGSVAASVAIPFTGNEAQIGSDDQEVCYWVGRLDEIRLSNVVLDPTDFLRGAPIPTVSEWGMVVAILLLLAAGTLVLMRQRHTYGELPG